MGPSNYRSCYATSCFDTRVDAQHVILVQKQSVEKNLKRPRERGKL